MPIPFEELAVLANRTQPSAVKRWCQKSGIRYMLDADRRPCTTEKALNDTLLRGRKTQPNFTMG